ncbi:hypothetical protein [Cupriavidus pauculus]|uniref:hypothetical protein n=1 Tax=Cupriavidus pauculus TaxID=82633 RepID=UPI0015DD8B65|nr:hypothetical protein [Cupriavidus pauculus]
MRFLFLVYGSIVLFGATFYTLASSGAMDRGGYSSSSRGWSGSSGSGWSSGGGHK